MIHLMIKPDFYLNSFGSKTCSELIWGHFYLIYSIWSEYTQFLLKKYWCLWLHVATPNRYIHFQNSKNSKHILIQNIYGPMDFGKGILGLLDVVLALQQLVVYWGVWQEHHLQTHSQQIVTESLPVGRYSHTYRYMYIFYVYVYIYIYMHNIKLCFIYNVYNVNFAT